MQTPMSEEKTERYSWVQRANRTIESRSSLITAWVVWFALALELAYASHYVRVMHKVSPLITVQDGSGCVCFDLREQDGKEDH
jgi:hypothetical protein